MSWRAVFEEQDGVARRSQLYAGGLTSGQLRARLASGRWRAWGPVVVVSHNGPLAGRQPAWAVVLGSGVSAALAGASALAEAGLRGWPVARVEVVVPKGQWSPPLPGIVRKVHQTRRFPVRELRMVRGLPSARVERAAVDAAAWSQSPRAACGLMAAVVQQRLTSAERLQAELSRAGAVRHARLLRAVMTDIAGGAQALTEVDFGDFCRRYGLPPPVRQVVRKDSAGRRRYVDAELRLGGCRVLVEIDGAMHLVATTYWADMLRLNDLALGGERVLRFPSVALYLDAEVVAAQLRRALGLLPRAA